MSIVVVDTGEIFLLKGALKGYVSGDQPLKIGLFSNNFTVKKNSVIGDLTAASFSGYAAQTLTQATWADPTTVGDVAQSLYGSGFLSWLAGSGTQIIYGYYVFSNDGTRLVWAENFASPITVSTVNPVMVWPVLRAESMYEPT